MPAQPVTHGLDRHFYAGVPGCFHSGKCKKKEITFPVIAGYNRKWTKHDIEVTAMRHERRVLGRAAAALVLTGVMMAAGSLTAMAAGSTGAGTAPDPKEQGPGVIAASEAEPEEKGAAVENGIIQPQNLEGAKDADQLVVVVGTGGCGADVYYYKKSGEAWEMAWKEAGIVGRNGITDQKAEGDGSTPSGTYGFTMAFGLRENPGSILPYHKIAKGDYWVDDSASPYYNKLVNTSQVAKNWNSAENMASASPYYNYALALNYNEACEPGKGSAIFLHCFTASRDNGSAGCIRLPQERAKELVQSATERTKIVIAPDLERLK